MYDKNSKDDRIKKAMAWCDKLKWKTLNDSTDAELSFTIASSEGCETIFELTRDDVVELVHRYAAVFTDVCTIEHMSYTVDLMDFIDVPHDVVKVEAYIHLAE